MASDFPSSVCASKTILQDLSQSWRINSFCLIFYHAQLVFRRFLSSGWSSSFCAFAENFADLIGLKCNGAIHNGVSLPWLTIGLSTDLKGQLFISLSWFSWSSKSLLSWTRLCSIRVPSVDTTQCPWCSCWYSPLGELLLPQSARPFRAVAISTLSHKFADSETSFPYRVVLFRCIGSQQYLLQTGVDLAAF